MIGVGLIAAALAIAAPAAPPERTVSGDFAVTLVPAGAPEAEDGVTVSRLTVDKTWTGALAGTSRGTMTAGAGPDARSAGYVMIERVRATLDGRSGGFLLQHSGTMEPGGQALSITVVPGSGSGGLAGLTSRLAIRIDARGHHYDFTYRLPSI